MKDSKMVLSMLICMVLAFGITVASCSTDTDLDTGKNKVNRSLTDVEADYLYSLHDTGEATRMVRSVARSVDDIASVFRDSDFTFCRIEDMAEETSESDGEPPTLLSEGFNGDGTYIYVFSYVVGGYKYEIYCNKEYSKTRWLTGDGWGFPPADHFHSEDDKCWFFFYDES